MSDKEKNPEFSIDIDEELTLDDSIFESEEEEKKEEFDDVLTEEELENLIIGIDEENDILDIPDEEEVLEELKFFDENFSLEQESKETSKKEIKEESKAAKKEKKKKIKAPREPFDFNYFLIKNKFKLLGAFLIFVIGIFLLTFFMVLDRAPKKNETKIESNTNTVAANEENKLENVSEVNSDMPDLSEEEKAIEIFKEELGKVEDATKKLELQKKILEIENQKIIKVREARMLNLKKYFDNDLPSLKISIMKNEENILVAAFVAQNSSYEEDLYRAVAKAFEDKYKIDKVSFNVLKAGDTFKKIGELTVDIKRFEEISVQEKSVAEKLKLMNYQSR